MMDPKKSAISTVAFYELTCRLKNVIRTGWKRWNVKVDRLESVADHVYGTCMLAIAIDSEFEYHLDIKKVVFMLSIHELEETIIGDITPFDAITPSEKKSLGRKAVSNILQSLIKGDEYIKLIDEFEERTTDEAKFAYMCDKLEADLMSFRYDLDGECRYEYADLNFIQNPNLVALRKDGAKSMSDFFYKYDRDRIGYDENFKAILDYAKSILCEKFSLL